MSDEMVDTFSVLLFSNCELETRRMKIGNLGRNLDGRIVAGTKSTYFYGAKNDVGSDYD
jgi:hypothetical protein